MEMEAALEQIKAAVGARGWIAEPADQEPYLVEARRLWSGVTRLVVRPASTAEVAAVGRNCAEGRLPIGPPGRNTGPRGRSSPPGGGQNLALPPRRLNRHRAIQPGKFPLALGPRGLL